MNQLKLSKLRRFKQYLIDESVYNKKSIIRSLISNSCSLAYSEPESQPCDILFLYVSKALNYRCDPLKRVLTQKGFLTADEAIMPPKNVLLNRYLCKPKISYPKEFLYEAAYAQYIVKKYQPKILITFMDSSILSVFLREEMKPFGKVINIAHGVTCDTNLFSMIDFDYLFLFGKRSLENLKRNKVLFGTTRVVLTGSPFITPDFILPANYAKKNILFFSSWIPKNERDLILNNFNIVRDWAKLHQEYHLYVKLHPSPLEDPMVWEKLAHGIRNITILDKKVDTKEALENVSLAVVLWSCASFEASILNRPVVIVNNCDREENFLYLENFFLPRSRSAEELHANILLTFDNYDFYLGKCKEFINYHFEHVHDSITYIADCIESIYRDCETFPVCELHENTAILENSN